MKSPCFCYLQFWAKFLTGNGQNGLVRPKYFEKLQIHEKKPFLSASSSLASLARASSNSADVTEDTVVVDVVVVVEIPQLSFAMSSDGFPQLSFAFYDFYDLSDP